MFLLNERVWLRNHLLYHNSEKLCYYDEVQKKTCVLVAKYTLSGCAKDQSQKIVMKSILLLDDFQFQCRFVFIPILPKSVSSSNLTEPQA